MVDVKGAYFKGSQRPPDEGGRIIWASVPPAWDDFCFPEFGPAGVVIRITSVVTCRVFAMQALNGSVLMTTLSLDWASHSLLWIVAFSFGLDQTILSSSFVCMLMTTGPSVIVMLNGTNSKRPGPIDSNLLSQW